MDLDISICTYQGGTFDVVFINRETGQELTFSGTQELDEEQFDFANKIAPACVWTKYRRITPED